jgi:hypothetical protein
LKEEIVNTPESSEVKYLHAVFPNLVKFVKNFEEIQIKKSRDGLSGEEELEQMR